MTQRFPQVRWDPSGSRVAAVAAPDLAEAVARLELLRPGALARLLAADGPEGGRGRNAVVPLPGRAEALHLRPFRHGGWLGRWRRDRLAGPSRVIAELDVHVRLHRRGAPVPRPVLAVAERRSAGRWTAAVGTVHAEGALNLGHWLSVRRAPDTVAPVVRAVGRALRRFHDLGGCHADLHVGNLLLRETDREPEVIVIDLDLARIAVEVPARRRMREIMRLARSLVKRRLIANLPPGAGDAFLAAYTAGDPPLRRALLVHLPRERRRLALHRLGYRG